MANITLDDISSRIANCEWVNKNDQLKQVITFVMVDYTYTKDNVAVSWVETYELGPPSATKHIEWQDVTEKDIRDWIADKEFERLENVLQRLEANHAEVTKPSHGEGLPWK